MTTQDDLRAAADDFDRLLAGQAALVEQLRTAEASAEETQELLREALLNSDRLEATVADLEARIAECDCPDPVVFGTSSKTGYGSAKERLQAVPGAFRYFVPSARIRAVDITNIQVMVADGCLPVISTWAGTEADTRANVQLLISSGLGDTRMGWAIAHEPTQKLSGPDFRALIERDYPIIRDALPNVVRLVIFQRWDWAAPARDNRNPTLYVPSDPTLVDAIGADIYDSTDDRPQTFAELALIVEDFATWYGNKPIWVCEVACPDNGDWGRPPEWRTTWMRELAAHVRWDRRYQVVIWFSSNIGQNHPPSGWWLWTSVESVEQWRRVMSGDTPL